MFPDSWYECIILKFELLWGIEPHSIWATSYSQWEFEYLPLFSEKHLKHTSHQTIPRKSVTLVDFSGKASQTLVPKTNAKNYVMIAEPFLMDNLQQLLWGEWLLCSIVAFSRFPLFWTSLEERAGGSLRRPPRGFNPVLCWRIKAKCQESTHCIIAAVFPESIFCVALGQCTLVNTGGSGGRGGGRWSRGGGCRAGRAGIWPLTRGSQVQSRAVPAQGEVMCSCILTSFGLFLFLR